VTFRPHARSLGTRTRLRRAYREAMNGRLPRYVFPDGTYHVVTRGVDGTAIFRNDADRRFFLRLFADVVQRHDWLVHVFCLMTNHYHLVVEALRDELSAGCHRLERCLRADLQPTLPAQRPPLRRPLLVGSDRGRRRAPRHVRLRARQPGPSRPLRAARRLALERKPDWRHGLADSRTLSGSSDRGG